MIVPFDVEAPSILPLAVDIGLLLDCGDGRTIHARRQGKAGDRAGYTIALATSEAALETLLRVNAGVAIEDADAADRADPVFLHEWRRRRSLLDADSRTKSTGSIRSSLETLEQKCSLERAILHETVALADRCNPSIAHAVFSNLSTTRGRYKGEGAGEYLGRLKRAVAHTKSAPDDHSKRLAVATIAAILLTGEPALTNLAARDAAAEALGLRAAELGLTIVGLHPTSARQPDNDRAPQSWPLISHPASPPPLLLAASGM